MIDILGITMMLIALCVCVAILVKVFSVAVTMLSEFLVGFVIGAKRGWAKGRYQR